MEKEKEFGIFFWLHMLFIVPAYLSPLLVSWKLILAGASVVQIQFWTLGGCVITHWEMGKGKSFLLHYLRKLNPDLTLAAVKRISLTLLISVVIVGFVLQHFLGFEPLLS